jgi:peptidoglycan/xylan/chitin deacetylase (PgdA/CDA1 family)
MSFTKPAASLSLDLDNKWSYMKTHGDAGWEVFPSYLDLVVPRLLRFLEENRLKITFFIVGQDAAIPGNECVLRSIAEAGHEIANHSFSHEPWLHLYSREQLEHEFDRAEAAIERVTGKRPVGFRGPGFSFSRDVLRLLVERGYQYDASTFPTFVGPLARMYYFRTARFKPGEREQRKALYGSFHEVFRHNRPYKWQVPEGTLLEIPATTMPLFRLPIHLSYVLYLAAFSEAVAVLYFRAFLQMCRLTETAPSFLLHPLDFLGCDDGCPELAFFPGMGIQKEKKMTIAARVLDLYAGYFRIVPMAEHAAEISRTKNLRVAKAKLGARLAPVARIATVDRT